MDVPGQPSNLAPCSNAIVYSMFWAKRILEELQRQGEFLKGVYRAIGNSPPTRASGERSHVEQRIMTWPADNLSDNQAVGRGQTNRTPMEAKV
jgi:hypothetical protein